MYKLIVVDDEEAIREGIVKGIDWAALGIIISGSASNGVEAMELIRKNPPDILLSDIRMPEMDGLELIQAVRDEYPGVKCVVLSGYNEFQYAQTALKNKVSEYLLKPTDIKEFEAIFQKISAELDEENSQKYEYEKLKNQVKDSLPLIRERFLNELVRGLSYDTDVILEKIRYLNLDLNISFLRVIVIEMDNSPNKAAHTEDDKNLLTYAIGKIAQEITEYRIKSVCFIKDDSVIIICNSQMDNGQLTEVIIQVQESTKKYLKSTVSAGIGRLYESFRQLPFSYMEAREALKYKIYTGSESIVFIEDVQGNSINTDMPTVAELEELVGYIWSGGLEILSAKMDALFDKYLTGGLKPLNYIDNICMGIVYAAFRYIEKVGADNNNLLELYDLNEIFNCDTSQAKKDCLLKILASMGNSISKYNNINVKKIVLAIKEYINKNYCDSNISLNLIADEFCKSSVYISKLFKNETGENFIDYLTRLRMEKAKELLANSLNLKAFEIAQNIGYTDISHFNKLFKKYTGFSPIEYRERPNTDNEDVY